MRVCDRRQVAFFELREFAAQHRRDWDGRTRLARQAGKGERPHTALGKRARRMRLPLLTLTIVVSGGERNGAPSREATGDEQRCSRDPSASASSATSCSSVAWMAAARA